MAKRKEDKKRERRRDKRRGRKFTAIIVIIFAEIGFILVITHFDLSRLFSPKPSALTAGALLGNTQMWVLKQDGNYSLSSSPPPIYNDSVVYITIAGIPAPKALLNSTVPVYVLMLDPLYGSFFYAPSYFYQTLFGYNYTVASRYQGRIFLVEPGQAPQQRGALLRWIVDALSDNGYTLAGTDQQVLQDLLHYLPIEIHFKGGQISSMQVLRALGTAAG